MPIPILMPALSPTMTEGTLVAWHKRPGDPVRSGDVVAEIETDKATMEIEAVEEGTLGRILIAEGTEGVAVNTTIALLLEEGEAEDALDAVAASEPAAAPAETPAPAPVRPDPAPAPDRPEGDRLRASPLARRMAARAGIDLAQIRGSGPNGRIIKVDVEAAVAAQVTPAQAAPGTGETGTGRAGSGAGRRGGASGARRPRLRGPAEFDQCARSLRAV